EILKTAVDAYRKMRNTLRWMLGNLAHFEGDTPELKDLPELEQLMLHRLHELDHVVRKGYDEFDFKRIFSQLSNFMTVELSSFYFDIRKDALYCDPPSSKKRKAALYVVNELFNHLVCWLAPMLPFTMEESFQTRLGDDGESIHMQQFPQVPGEWKNDPLVEKWRKIRTVRRVVTGALETERREKRIGSSLEAAPLVSVTDASLMAAIEGQDMAEICITSSISVTADNIAADAFVLDDVPGVGVLPKLAEGQKCARSWKVLPEVGSDAEYPDISPRDAEAMREIDASS
ncbi:MAG: class I tRNA ligase family protein, partial [Pseudomonadota bacterium]